jgi:hypothetical protein
MYAACHPPSCTLLAHPRADFLNHSPASSAHLDWEQGPGSEGGVTLVADRAYKAGEQIGALLTRQGFAIPWPHLCTHVDASTGVLMYASAFPCLLHFCA